MKEGNLVTGGGKDGRLVQLDASLNPTGQETRVPEHLGTSFLVTVLVGRVYLDGKSCIIPLC